MPPEPSHQRHFLERNDWFDSRLFQAGAWLLLGSYMVIQIVSSMAVPVGKFDDCIPLVAADLVRRGRVPSTGFWTPYPPLPYYLIAGGFRLFGRTFLVYRALSAFLCSTAVVAIARYFWIRAARLRPLVPFMVLAVAAGICASMSLPSLPGFALGLLAVLAYTRSLDQPQAGTGIRWTLAVAGSVAGIAALFRFNVGLYALAVPLIDLPIGEMVSPEPRPLKARLRRILAPLATFVIPFALVNAAVYTVIYGRGVVPSILRMAQVARAAMGPLRFVDLPLHAADYVVWPCAWVFVSIVLTSDRLPGRAIAAICPAFPLLAATIAGRHTPSVAIWLTGFGILVVVALYIFVVRFSRTGFCLLLYFICSLHYYLSRADEYHAFTVFGALLLTVPFLFLAHAGGADPRPAGRGLVFVALIGAAWMAGRGTVEIPMFLDGLRPLVSGSLRLPVSDAERLASGNRQSPWVVNAWDEKYGASLDELKVVEFIRSKTGRGDPIFVGVRDHSRIFWNDLRIYWLADRIPGCRYVDLEADTARRAEVQRQIVSDLGRNAVQWAVLEDNSGMGDDAFRRRVTAGSTVLDDFFVANFREVARFGLFSVVQRAAWR